MNFTEKLKKNIGAIVAGISFFIIIILTYCNILEINTARYRANVWSNLINISLMSAALTFIQVAVRQGICEQFLTSGMNTENTIAKYGEHKEVLERLKFKNIFMPFFLRERNARMTRIKKSEYLASQTDKSGNIFLREADFYARAKKSKVRKYNSLRVCWTPDDLRWTSTQIEYDKENRIIKLPKHRIIRARNGILTAIASMLVIILIAKNLFDDFTWNNFSQQTVQIVLYAITIAITTLFPAAAEYEYGKFTMPNILDEINLVLFEFENWNIPDEVWNDYKNKYVFTERELRMFNKWQPEKELKGGSENEKGGTAETDADSRADIQTQPQEGEVVKTACPDNVDNAVVFDPVNGHIGV